MIEQTIDIALAEMAISSSENLDGFVIDADSLLGGMDIAGSCKVVTTNDKRNSVKAVVTLNAKAHSVQKVCDEAQNAWLKLAYNDFQAASLVAYEEGVVLRFVTTAKESQLCVTGSVLLSSDAYQRIYEEYLAKYAFAGIQRQHVPGHLGLMNR
jgi:hypothetical protein